MIDILISLRDANTTTSPEILMNLISEAKKEIQDLRGERNLLQEINEKLHKALDIITGETSV